jgi:hypothetical protein
LTKPRIDAAVLDVAPTDDKLTDADADRVPWEEASRAILHIDADTEPKRARRAHRSHLARAQWMTRAGYRHILIDEKLGKSGDSR